MDYLNIVKERYAAKKFDGKKIDNEKINELEEIIRYTPSSRNMQPWKIIVISDDSMKEKLKPASNNQEQITTCSHLFVFCANINANKIVDDMEIEMLKNSKPEDIQKYISSLRTFAQNTTKDKMLAWAQNQVYIALGNALIGAKSLGFDSCPMGGFNPSEYSRILELDENTIPTVLMPVGYAIGPARPKMRLPKDKIFL